MSELGPGEVIVADLASSVNCNTVWPDMFDPVPMFRFFEHNRLCPWAHFTSDRLEVLHWDGSDVFR